MRQLGMKDEDLGLVEFSMPWVATTNTIPSLFWLVAHIFSNPQYVERVCFEASGVVIVENRSDGHCTATFEISKLEKSCPFLVACYKEVLRLYNDLVGNRRVMQDTTLQDSDGREYVLNKGTNVQWVSGVPHLDKQVWGQEAEAFNPEQWLEPPSKEGRARRAAMIPFGGGKHLCPGRNFAQAEVLGIVAALSLGYVITGVKVPPPEDPYPGSAARRPVWGQISKTIQISRRDGWEDVRWVFSR
jgi:cytochrome P450